MSGKDNRTRGGVDPQGVYFESRFPALALALALTLDEEKAYAASLRAHASLFAGSPKNISVQAILRRIKRIAKPAAQGKRRPDALYGMLSGLPARERAAWALKNVAGMPAEQVGMIIGKPVLLAENSSHATAEAFASRVTQLLEKKELLSDILFYAGKKRALTTRFLRVGMAAAVVAALFFLAREGYVLARVLSAGTARDDGVLTMRSADPAFFRKAPEEPLVELPGVNQPLMDAMQNVANEQPVRVSFRFYDESAMRSVKPHGKTLEDIYAELYASCYERGRVNALTAAAVNEYYANYVRPFLVVDRAKDFVSAYAGVYETALILAGSGGYARTAQAHPEIFASKATFDAYLYSPAFLSKAPALSTLLGMERRISAGEETQDAALRTAYEDALFAFFNPGGQAGRVATEPFSFESGEMRAFYAAREEMGKLLYLRNTQACAQALPQGAQVTSDILEGTDCSLFSATLAKADVLRLARDERFFFLGVTAPPEAEMAGRAEAELLARAREGLLAQHEVYLINTDYLLYSVNFAAPLNLPQGFRDSLRKKLGIANTQFEMEVQYAYQMRYAHPQVRTGYGILRSLALDPNACYATRESKPFSVMAAY